MRTLLVLPLLSLGLLACSEELTQASGGTSSGSSSASSTSGASSSSGSSSSSSGISSTSSSGGPAPVELALGDSHACARMSDGTVRCWGGGSRGELGDDAFEDHAAPVRVHGVERAVKLAAGMHHTCALQDDGGVLCWGMNLSGETGRAPCATANAGPCADDATPKPTIFSAHAKDVAAGWGNTCALLGEGTASCWGDVSMLLSAPSSTQPIAAKGVSGGVAIAMGYHHACVQTASDVRCFGDGTEGQLGDGKNVDDIWIRPDAEPVVDLGAARRVALGASSSCAIQASTGALLCWGGATSTTLDGEGNPIDAAGPVLVPGLAPTAIAVGAGGQRCAIDGAGRVACWGWNNFGQVGDGTKANRLAPAMVQGLGEVVEIAAGGSFTCARQANGDVMCWGANLNGQLGGGSFATTTLAPVRVAF